MDGRIGERARRGRGGARARDTKGGGGGAERERIGERQTDRTGERVGVERDGVRGRGGGGGHWETGISIYSSGLIRQIRQMELEIGDACEAILILT